MKDKCYIHVFRLVDEIYIRCSQTGKMAKMEKDLLEVCPVCNRPIFIQTDELYPNTRTVRQIFSKYLDRWLNIEEGG
jgi:hypothetical protein